VDFAGGNQSSDGGLLLLQQVERKLAVCARLAAAMPDRRDASCVEHETLEMVTARVSAIACGHKDAIGPFGSFPRSQRLDERGNKSAGLRPPHSICTSAAVKADISGSAAPFHQPILRPHSHARTIVVIFNRELPAGRAGFCAANGSVSARGGATRGHKPITVLRVLSFRRRGYFAAARLAIQNRFRGGDHALPKIDPFN